MASAMSYLYENEAKNLPNGDVQIAQIQIMRYLAREPFGALTYVMARILLHCSRSFI